MPNPPPHTPGPWTVAQDPEAPYLDDPTDDKWWSVYTDQAGAINAEIAGRIGEEANARLIAAAPEMRDFIAALAQHNTPHGTAARALLARIDKGKKS